MKTQTFTKAINKGFTLIELLIVIAVLGVLAAATLAAIDPIDKINAGNDSRAQSDIAALASASETFAATHDGAYPPNMAALVTTGDLKANISAPTGYTYTAAPIAAGCTFTVATGVSTCTGIVWTANLKSKKFTSASTPIRRYESATGKTCNVATAATPCP